MKILPIGIESFKTMIDKNAYYVDKTNFIREVINEQFVLYTRPRRFGKTLNMSMLYYFFSNQEIENAYLFDGFKVTSDPEVMKHQNQYPVIFITLKDMKALNFDDQQEQFAFLISSVVKKFRELLESPFLDEDDKDKLRKYKAETNTTVELKNSLLVISQCLEKHYGQKVMIFIDEYDVPLQSAYVNNYYDKMVDFLRGIFSAALKTNESLEKGVLTGCLRIAKESIFTGLNNFNVYSLLDYGCENSFGFSEDEVKKMLAEYDLSDCFDSVKEWYDGYLFGNTEIYNPWSTLNYIHRKLLNLSSESISFWANTSGNDIVYRYIEDADDSLHGDFEQLMQGNSIQKTIYPELTYRDMDDIDNIYSFLLLTGYLKIKNRVYNSKTHELIQDQYELVIPNKEVYEIYRQSFMNYFRTYTRDRKKELYQALLTENVDYADTLLNDILEKSISYYDNYENFYHGFLVGLFSNEEVESNREAGDGRFDIMILPRRISGTALVIECKHSSSDMYLTEDSKRAAQQIIEKRYIEDKNLKKYRHTVGYGISFFKKQCCITKASPL